MASLDDSTDSSPGNGRSRVEIRPLWLLAAVVLATLATLLAWLQPPDPQPLKSAAQRSLIDRAFYPVEQHVELRLPTIPNPLNSVIFAPDEQRGWAVGQGGTIVATQDGGKAWATQSSGVTANLLSIHVNADGQRVWAVGNDGTIVATQDGGKTWAAQSSGVTANLFSIHVNADGQRGWAVGDDSTIVATQDGGKTWAAQSSGVTANLFSIHVNADGQRGWAVGNRGTIAATQDGGKTWAAQSSGVTADLFSIHVNADGQRGSAVGAGGTIVATQDGGKTWAAQSSGATANLFSIHVNADGQRGWAVGGGGTIVATQDGGKTWASQSSGATAKLSSIHVSADGQRGWAVGGGGTIVATQDGGKTWAAQSSGATAALWSIHMNADGQRGWAVGDDGTIVATQDGGKAWAAPSSGVTANLFSIHVNADGQRVWAVGNDGTIVATQDGGKTWAAQSSGATAALWFIHVNADGQRGWAVGAGGTIVATQDGGKTWAAQSSGVTADLFSIHVNADGQRGWAVGTDGTIVATQDGGKTWAAQSSGVTAALLSIHVNADGQRGWAGGNRGTIVATQDGGKTWAAQSSGVTANLFSIHVSADGQRGWAVGDSGTVLRTGDGGSTWKAMNAGIGSARRGVAFAADGKTGWMVGYPPALMQSTDGGETWVPVALPFHYARYPAPWYWAALLVAGVLIWLALRRELEEAESGAAGLAATDAPSGDFARDRLQFGPLARGISRFLRNSRTEPPLTLAISGDWGSGKSTLMALLCTDLRRYGLRPVWFNAWHHQKEEHLLAALLEQIRRRGLPSNFVPDGWVFRLHLLWIRSKKHFFLLFVVTALITTLATYLCFHELKEWEQLWRFVERHGLGVQNAAKGDDLIELENVGRVFFQILGGIGAFGALYRAVKAFGADPAVLIATAAQNFRLKDATAQNSFRARFSEQFEEVTNALPYRMVIVIDDLDRCQPETVLEVMEAVNFLASSGRCFVVFGMATHRVNAALGLNFEKIARELLESVSGAATTSQAQNNGVSEREHRLAYARDYLEKLVNLEVAVPDRVDLPAHVLLEDEEAERVGLGTRIGRGFTKLWPLYVIAGAISIGIVAGMQWTPPRSVSKEPGQTIGAKTTAATDAKKSTGTADGTKVAEQTVASAAPQAQAPLTRSEVTPGQDRPISPWFMGSLIVFIVTTTATYVVLRLRASVREVEDSAEFRDAMRTWAPVVRLKRSSPRAIKRFGNRIRYFAMLQHPEAQDRSLLDEFLAKVRGWTGRPARNAPSDAAPSPELAIAEHRLAALGAIYEVYGDRWREVVVMAPSQLPEELQTAISTYRAQGTIAWPPSDDELDVFARLLRGVRLAGDLRLPVTERATSRSPEWQSSSASAEWPFGDRPSRVFDDRPKA